MKIGNVKLKNNLFLAPMAGVTDVAFRSLCRSFGAGLSYTEMVSAKGLYYNDKKTANLLKTAKNETPVAVQLFGSEPEIFASVVKNPLLKKFDIIDINMGCPAPKIVKNKEGSYLMNNPSLAAQIVRACVENTTKPVTVKMRLGYNKNNAVEFAKAVEQAGASAITVHGRLRSEFYTGKADWEEIKKVASAVKIPLIANGDVCSREDYDEILKVTGASAVMVGRASLGAPYIFAKMLGKNTRVNKYKLLKKQIKLSKKFGVFKITEMRKHFAWYLKNERGVSEVKNKVFHAESEKEAMALLKPVLNKSVNI